MAQKKKSGHRKVSTSKRTEHRRKLWREASARYYEEHKKEIKARGKKKRKTK